jgi:hypothetical protein
MTDYLKQILSKQFEAALCMFHECVTRCPAEQWDGRVAKYPFWQVAYHTLCFVDLYLSPDEATFAFRVADFHPHGASEFDDEHPSRRFTQRELLDYVAICRAKARDVLSAETDASLQGASGFPGRPATRGELHLYNLRHIMHHTGQLSAYLRRVDPSIDPRWVGSGWR